MSTNIRDLMERHLSVTLEGGFSMLIKLTSPDGARDEVQGQVLYDTQNFNPDTGETVVVNNPIVSMRISSLKTVPGSTEKWVVNIPESPVAGAPRIDYMYNGKTRTAEGGRSIGFIRLYLRKVKQKT